MTWVKHRFAIRPTLWVAMPKGKTLGGLLRMPALNGGRVRIMLVGERPGGGSGRMDRFHAWRLKVPAGWEEEAPPRLAESMLPVLTYRHVASRTSVTIAMAATWFGEGDYGPTDCERALAWVDDALRGRSVGAGANGSGRSRYDDDEAAVHATPAVTGQHLLARLVPYELGGQRFTGWPCLDPDLQAHVRSVSTQGRQQILETAGDELPALHLADARWAYAGCLRALGSGGLTLDRSGTWLGYHPALYRIEARVPDGWRHIGPFGVPGDQEAGDTRWLWPSTPGQRYTTWVDGAELHNVLGQRACFGEWAADLRIVEALVYRKAEPGPLQPWGELLVRLADQVRARGDAEHAPEVGRLAAIAVRAILIHTIGALHGRPRRQSVTVHQDQADAVPDDADWRWSGDHITYEADTGRQSWPQMAHPELAVRVWGVHRSRMARAAMELHPTELVAIQSDALYSTAPGPSWHEDGPTVPIGHLRRKWTLPGPVPAPRAPADLAALQARAVAAGANGSAA